MNIAVQEITTQQAEMQTKRLRLRPLQTSDTAPIRQFSSDKRLAEMTRRIPHPLPAGASEAFVSRALAVDEEEVIWAMDATAAGRGALVGVISLQPMGHRQSEIGYWVAPDMWHEGLASEAVQALVETNPLQDETLFASVFQDNPASSRVLERAGFVYVGEAESHSLTRDAIVPTWTYLRRMSLDHDGKHR